eukprot:gene9733-11953_t
MFSIYDFDSFSKDEYIEFFTKLLLTHYTNQIEHILSSPDPKKFYSLAVEFHSSNSSTITLQEKYFSVKNNCRVRVCDIPAIFNETKLATLPRSSDYGLFVEFRGTVVRTAQPKVLERTKNFECTKCGHIIESTIDYEQYNMFVLPKRCTNPESNCVGGTFNPINQPGEHIDYQEIKLQEQIHHLSAGSIPRSILILLQEDLVSSCQAGDDLTVSGVAIRRWRPIRPDERCDVEIVLLANHVRIMNEQRMGVGLTDEIRTQFEDFWILHEHNQLEGRNKILKNICPAIFGLFVVKLALMLILIGGVPTTDSNGVRKRGDCHMLMVGEPGTGKSQFLKYAAKLASRSVITTGIGTTTAGLTAAAVKESGGEMALEAGALVLADGGICCIDEFSGIKEKDRSTIHEAMEQQTLSISKGGMNTRLHTRTSILAATNAKGKYDPNESLMVNTNLATPLLSRFDIIILLTDEVNPQWDRLISDFILNQTAIAPDEDVWSLELLQSYIYYVKATFQPTMTPDSARLIDNYFQKQRTSNTHRNEARTTYRLLDSLIRLSQAHARLMFRNTVEVQDAVVAIYLIESSIESNCILTNLNAQHSIFPSDPDNDYKALERKIKNSLGLSNITSRQLPRRKSKPKAFQHKTNTNWVNSNYDEESDEEDEDDEGEENNESFFDDEEIEEKDQNQYLDDEEDTNSGWGSNSTQYNPPSVNLKNNSITPNNINHNNNTNNNKKPIHTPPKRFEFHSSNESSDLSSQLNSTFDKNKKQPQPTTISNQSNINTTATKPIQKETIKEIRTPLPPSSKELKQKQQEIIQNVVSPILSSSKTSSITTTEQYNDVEFKNVQDDDDDILFGDSIHSSLNISQKNNNNNINNLQQEIKQKQKPKKPIKKIQEDEEEDLFDMLLKDNEDDGDDDDDNRNDNRNNRNNEEEFESSFPGNSNNNNFSNQPTSTQMSENSQVRKEYLKELEKQMLDDADINDSWDISENESNNSFVKIVSKPSEPHQNNSSVSNNNNSNNNQNNSTSNNDDDFDLVFE